VRVGADLARYYDLDVAEEMDDLDLYLALAARTGGPVLELAVGTGRLAVELALAGYRVVGVDIDPDMLARAEARWERERGSRPASELRLVENDVVKMRSPERFRLVILALNGLLLLGDRDAQMAALGTMAAHLEPEGLGVVDIAIPSVADLVAYDGRTVLEWIRDDTGSGDVVSKTVSSRYDAAMNRLELIQSFDAWASPAGIVRRAVRRDRLLLLGADQLHDFASRAGLLVEQSGSDLELAPFGPGSDRLVLVCRLV
jgi:SAM-dependent methyltransferase